ncbi:Rhomboid family [Rhizoctonia solani]|uniref:Rhomboid family n=1 Tax=Rhizoctonia solani TaxID=456999 RepID=A0A8H7HBX9_9AGAM|nr:Rhomboid family [Rhizoctonia solani]
MSGFQNAPITKGLMIATGALSLVIGLADVRYYFQLQLSPHISRDHQSFLIAAALVSTLLNFSFLIALHRFGLNYIPAGPIAILFAIIYQYERLVPSAYNFRILGITMSNKAFTYLTAFPMVISHMPGSALVTLTGIATGALYRSDITNLKSYRAPPWFVSTISSLVGASRAPHMPRRAIPGERPPFSTEQVVTRRRVNEPREESDARTDVNTANGTARAATGSSSGSVMREWVDELTGRRDGGRVPTAAEIAELTSVFPHASREEIISALQRRYANFAYFVCHQN